MRVHPTGPLLAVLSLGIGCGGSAPPPSDHPAQESHAHTSGRGVEPPRARLAFIEVPEGPLTEERARAALASTRPRVQACLAASSIRVEGHVVVRLEVTPSGEVARSGTEHVDGIDPEMVFCLVRAVRGCRMPRADGPSVVHVGLDLVDPRAVEQRTAQPEIELADDPLPPLETEEPDATEGEPESEEGAEGATPPTEGEAPDA